MTASDKIIELKQTIKLNLQPLISNKVAILGLPAHGNIGDTLIALGELEFIKELGAKCIYKRIFIDDNPKFPDLPHDCTIICQGGGDFGDIWRGIHNERLKVIERYPNNNIIIFPQSVYYQDEELLHKDAIFLSKYTKLTICTRDQYSYDLLNKYFFNRVLLVPDIAFYLPQKLISNNTLNATKNHLYLKRIDKELGKSPESITNCDTQDWPTINNDSFKIKLIYRLLGWTAAFRIRQLHLIEKILHNITIFYLINYLYPNLAKCGIKFISSYKKLSLTRLHSAILAVLLDKEFTFFDNSYSKNKNFFIKWLSNLSKIHFIE